MAETVRLRCADCGEQLPQDYKANGPYPWPRCLACTLGRAA